MKVFNTLLVLALSTALPAHAQWNTSGTDTTTTNNVGVGMSTAPSTAFDVNGVTRLRGNIFMGAPLGSPGKLYLWSDPSGSRIEGTGIGMNLVGMGGTILLTNADTVIRGFTSTSAGAAANIQNASANSILFARNDGRVGIGTTNPQTTLHIAGATFGVSPYVTIDRPGPTADGAILFRTQNNGSTQWLIGKSANLGNEDLAIGYPDFAPVNQRLVISSNGNIGVGISSPQHKLHVNGSVMATGVIGSVYQDVAEWVPATTDMEPGTVVILNPERSNEVMQSNGAYDTRVAGVVSDRPGILLGVEDASKEQVATTGRVRVRVDARKAAIRVGDLLVTGEEPGSAMRSEPMQIGGRPFHQPGTIIGKALEPLDSGVGEILVLLSMQ